MTLINQKTVDAASIAQLQATSEKSWFDKQNSWGFRILQVCTAGYLGVGLVQHYYVHANSPAFDDLAKDFAKKQIELSNAKKDGSNFKGATQEKTNLRNERDTLGHALCDRVVNLTKAMPAEDARKIVIAAKFQVQQAVQGQVRDKKVALNATDLVTKTISKKIVEERFSDALNMPGIKKAYDKAVKDLRTMSLSSDDAATKKILNVEIHSQLEGAGKKSVYKRAQKIVQTSAYSKAAKTVATSESANLTKLATERRACNDSIDKSNATLKSLTKANKELKVELKELNKELSKLKAPKSRSVETLTEYNADRADLQRQITAVQAKLDANDASELETRRQIRVQMKKATDLTTKIEKIRVLFPKVEEHVGGKKHKIPSRLSPSEKAVKDKVTAEAQADAALLKKLFKKA